MSEVTDRFKKDAAFLRDIASREKDRGWNSPEQIEDVERLKRIADNVEMMSTAMFEPSLQRSGRKRN
jgi:hypothetical protein